MSLMILICFKHTCRVCQSALSAFNFILHENNISQTLVELGQFLIIFYNYMIDEQNTGPPSLAYAQYQEYQLSLFET